MTGSVVELTVAVMCSCLTTFPGFFRYHLPLLRSIVSLFSSTLKSLHLPKFQNTSSNTNSSERLATKDIKITLGSRVDGRGLFLNSVSLFGTANQTIPLSDIAHDSTTSEREARRTRREDIEELAESRRPAFKHLMSSDSQVPPRNNSFSTERDIALDYTGQRPSSIQYTQSSGLKESKPSRKFPWKMRRLSGGHQSGYWNILSMFRTGGPQSTLQSSAYC